MMTLKLGRSDTESLSLRSFLHHCFPDLAAMLQQYFTTFFDTFIMAEEPKQCKEFHVLLSGKYMSTAFGEGAEVVFRNPTLLPVQIVGIMIGLLIGVSINKHDGMSMAYSWAFINFALMNLTSIVGHCIGHPGSTLWSLGIDLDVAFTGASCICLVLAALNARSIVVSTPLGIRCIAPLCIAVIVVNSYTIRLPFAAEMMYLGNLLIASVVLFWHYTASYWKHPMYNSYISLAIFGAAIAVGGCVFDHKLCVITFGAFTSIPAVFLGCCFAFMSVYLFAFNLEAQKINKLRKD